MSTQGPRILQNTVTSGTGPFSLLDPAPKSFQRFRDVLADGSRTTVIVLDQNAGAWAELLVQLAYGAPDTLTTLAVISSSNANTAVTFGNGSKLVIQCQPSYGSQATDKIKQACRAALTTNMALSSVVVGATVDGVSLSAGDRVGLFGQTTATECGIWIVQAVGSPLRAVDFSAGDTVSSAVIPVRLGTLHSAQVFQVTSEPGSDIVGTSSLTFAIGVGQPGATGPAGNVWRDGSGVPSNSLGIDGDYYLNDATADVYKRAAGTYAIVANIKGATGPAGPANSLAIGTVTTLLPGAAATATITGTAPSQTLNLGIPVGTPGTGAGNVIGPGVSTVDALAAWNDTAGLHLRNSTVGIDHANYDKLMLNASVPKLLTSSFAGGSITCDLDQANGYVIPFAQSYGDVVLTGWSVGQIVTLLMIGGKALTWSTVNVNWLGGSPPDFVGNWTCVTLWCEASVIGSGSPVPTFYEIARTSSDGLVPVRTRNTATSSTTTPSVSTTLAPGCTNIVSSDGTAGRTMFLPPAVAGMSSSMRNTMSVTIVVYSQGPLINGSTGALSLTFAAGTSATFVFDGSYWWTLPKVPS